MIGLAFLVAGLLWFLFSVYVATRVPKWFGVAKPLLRWTLCGVVLLSLLVGPFVDHIVGIRQFDKLCADARESIRVASNIDRVTRAKVNATKYIDVSGYFVPIQMVRREFLDLDTGHSFLSYQTFFTNGGKIAALAQFGGEYSCEVDGSPQFLDIWKKHNIQNLMEEGRKQ